MENNKNMATKGEDISNRLFNFAVKIIDLVNRLPKNPTGKHIAGQLLRCGTSPGSNYEEARGGESKADFIHKLGIVLKELKESRYWLKLINATRMLDSLKVIPLIEECGQLCAIIAKSIITTKKRD
jgi:four helix bundle protein